MTQVLSHPRSPSPQLAEPPAKKTRVEDVGEKAKVEFEKVDYADGLHLAPMVRSGTRRLQLAQHPLHLTTLQSQLGSSAWSTEQN